MQINPPAPIAARGEVAHKAQAEHVAHALHPSLPFTIVGLFTECILLSLYFIINLS